MIQDIERLLERPAAEALAGLLEMPEGQWYDRKSARVAPRDLAPVLVAMANAEGGYVAVGVHGGKVEPVSPGRVNDYRQVGVGFTEPPVKVSATEIPVNGSGSVLVLRVEAGRRVHTTAAGVCYLRIGDESRKLGYAQRQQLEYERGVAPFETLPVDRQLSGLSHDRMAAYQQAIGSASVDGMLHARDLLTEDEKPTVAAWLLFADRPQSVFAEACVRVLRYQDVFRGSGDELQLIEGHDVRLEGPISEQIRQAEEVVDEWLPKRRALREDGRFGAVPLLPPDAWREGLVNAVIHRSYGWVGDHIRVEVFPDRLEITNPGGLPGLGDAKDPLSIKRYARNPRIARFAAETGLAEELGEGIQRMFRLMREAGLDDPVYSAAPTQVRLTLYMSKRNGDLDGLPKTAAAILGVMRRAGAPLRVGDIAQLAAVSNMTAIRHLKRLREEGLVERQATSPTDPHATWSLA